jgi:muramidase (phage lysozyme)
MAKRIPNQDYVKHFDSRLESHRKWLLAVLDELTVRDPDALSKGRLRDLWTAREQQNLPLVITRNEAAWLKVVRFAEGTDKPVEGYRETFGYLRKIDTSKPHPGIVNRIGSYSSDASGAYQFLSTTWKDIHGGKNPPMTPRNQDRAALALMRRRGLDPKTAEFTAANLAKLAPEWASLPMATGKSYYGQPVHEFKTLEGVFRRALSLNAAPSPVAMPEPAPTSPPKALTQQAVVSTLTLAGEHEAGLDGPDISAPLKPGDHYLLVNGRAGAARAYDHAGKFLWVAPVLTHGQVPNWKTTGGDTPPGLYAVGQIHADYEDDPSEAFSEIRRSYGWFSLDLVEMENQEAGVGRAGIMIHGGGTEAGWPGAWAQKQPLHSTLGCIRAHNVDLRDKIVPLARKGKLYVGVYQP